MQFGNSNITSAAAALACASFTHRIYQHPEFSRIFTPPISPCRIHYTVETIINVTTPNLPCTKFPRPLIIIRDEEKDNLIFIPDQFTPNFHHAFSNTKPPVEYEHVCRTCLSTTSSSCAEYGN